MLYILHHTDTVFQILDGHQMMLNISGDHLDKGKRNHLDNPADISP